MTNVSLIGRINTDITARTVGSYRVVSFLVGVPGAGKWNKTTNKTEWASFPVEAWGKTAETIEKHCPKGTNVAISGSLKLDTWTDSSGNEKERVKIVVSDFKFLPAAPENYVAKEEVEEEDESFTVDPFV
jgi:single-strand DNA-binding protein